jgi:hypothetical protein
MGLARMRGDRRTRMALHALRGRPVMLLVTGRARDGRRIERDRRHVTCDAVDCLVTRMVERQLARARRCTVHADRRGARVRAGGDAAGVVAARTRLDSPLRMMALEAIAGCTDQQHAMRRLGPVTLAALEGPVSRVLERPVTRLRLRR